MVPEYKKFDEIADFRLKEKSNDVGGGSRKRSFGWEGLLDEFCRQF